MSQATKTLGNSKKLANKRGEDLIIRRFLSDLMREKSNVASGDDYNYDPVDDITDSMAGLTLNSATINAIKSAIKRAVKKSSGHKCSKCSKSGHNSCKCPQKKKKKSKFKGKVNLTTEDSDSDLNSSNASSSNSSDSDTSFLDSSDSDGDLNVHITKSKKK